MKKWLILLAVLIGAGIVAGVMLSRGGNGAQSNTSGGATVITVAGGHKIKFVVTGPSELQVTWQKLEDTMGSIYLSGTIKNTSSRTITIDQVRFFLDGKQEGFWPSFGIVTLKPGEEKLLQQEVVGLIYEAKVLEMRILVNGLQSTSSTPPAPPTQEPTVAGPSKLTYKKNPVTPEEVTAAFVGLMQEKKYSEAEKLLGPNLLQEFNELKNSPGLFAKIHRVELVRESNDEAEVKVFYFENGEEEHDYVHLKKVGKTWKLDR